MEARCSAMGVGIDGNTILFEVIFVIVMRITPMFQNLAGLR